MKRFMPVNSRKPFLRHPSSRLRQGFAGQAVLRPLLLLLLLLSACAPVAPERQRFFWPPGTEQPRIEYIDFYLSEDDAKRGAENWVADAIFGKEKPTRLFSRPQAIASDGNGRVFIADIDLHKVFVFDLKNHNVRVLKASGGGELNFGFPSGLAVDDSGRIYVADSFSKDILVFGADEEMKASYGRDSLERPTGLAIDSRRQRLYVVDTGSHEIDVFSLDGAMLRSFGGRGSGEGEFNFPLDADVDGEGNLYVLDSMNARVQVFDPEGNFLRAFGERGTASGSFQIAKSLAVSPWGHVYVTDSQAHRFVVFDLEGNYLLTVGGKSPTTSGEVSPGGFYLPQGIDVDGKGAIWVVDSLNRLFHRFQYLTDEYLEEHPILPGQTYLPPGFDRGKRQD